MKPGSTGVKDMIPHDQNRPRVPFMEGGGSTGPSGVYRGTQNIGLYCGGSVTLWLGSYYVAPNVRSWSLSQTDHKSRLEPL